jgi:hypothetical protein
MFGGRNLTQSPGHRWNRRNDSNRWLRRRHVGDRRKLVQRRHARNGRPISDRRFISDRWFVRDWRW